MAAILCRPQVLTFTHWTVLRKYDIFVAELQWHSLLIFAFFRRKDQFVWQSIPGLINP